VSGVSVVVPTVGRPSLAALLTALATGAPCPLPVEIVLVDDRPDRSAPLPVPPGLAVRVVPARAAGPAAARNAGWRAARHEWVAFLDDDVLPGPDWLDRLGADLSGVDAQVGGVQGNLRVPLPVDRRPTDWERVTAGLADGAWITADMAYRRGALARTGGFDERLPRAFREDAELAHRVRRAGWRLRRGQRWVTHPVRPESPWVSVRTQRGNADDALLRRLYGPGWRDALQIPPGRRHRHAAVTAAGVLALTCGLAALATRRRGWTAGTALAAAAWAAGTAEFAAARIVPGPRNPREIGTMLVTSAVIPPLAVTHWLRGWRRWRGARPLPASPTAERIAAGAVR
jgi:cellulose synthase/poly-beta-1,6-N-acetylglucosamine synthase-like glycosyltransferase